MAIWSTANSIRCIESVVATRYFTSPVLIFLFMQIRVCTIIYDILNWYSTNQADIKAKKQAIISFYCQWLQILLKW